MCWRRRVSVLHFLEQRGHRGIGESDERRGGEMKEREEEACRDLSGLVGNWRRKLARAETTSPSQRP